MSAFTRTAFLLIAWTAAIAGTLQLNRLPGDWGHVCGPWGCGPSVKALLVWHLFWLGALSLPVVLAAWHLSRKWLRRLGLTAMAVGGVGIAGVLAVETIGSLSPAIRPDLRFLVARCLFRLATLVDVPLVQLALLGGLCWAAALVSDRAKVPLDQSAGITGSAPTVPQARVVDEV